MVLAETHKNKPFSKDRLFSCCVFIAAIKENIISQRYDAVKEINIFKAL
jgi:hypothetical protein